MATATPGFASQAEVYAALIRQGADPNLAKTLAAITRPESSGYTAANNGTYLGLFQIGNYHGFDNARLLSGDIDYQAAAALQVYHQQGLDAWETYTNGSYLKYLNASNSPALSGQGDLSNFADIANAGAGAAVQGAQQALAQPLLASQQNPISAPAEATTISGAQPSVADAPDSGAPTPIDAPGEETASGNPIDGPHGFDQSISPSGV